MILRRYAVLMLLAGFPLLAACGVSESKLAESGATLTGTISHQGKPIEFAQVIVKSKDGLVAYGKVRDDGKYKVENVPLGEVNIGVNTKAAEGDFRSASMRQNAAAANPKASTRLSAPTFVNVPDKFFDPDKSGVTTTVQKGENTFDIKCD